MREVIWGIIAFIALGIVILLHAGYPETNFVNVGIGGFMIISGIIFLVKVLKDALGEKR